MPEGHTLHRLAAEYQRVFGGERVRVSSPQGPFAPAALRLMRCQAGSEESAGRSGSGPSRCWTSFLSKPLISAQVVGPRRSA